MDVNVEAGIALFSRDSFVTLLFQDLSAELVVNKRNFGCTPGFSV